jgi:hypothetical protein
VTHPKALRVVIRSVLYKNQRYNTCGDWYESDYYSFETGAQRALEITVSELPDRREMFLVAIHELIEAFLCECAGVTEQAVDQFDYGFEQMRVPSDGEPGDQITAPYYRQHQIATGIERILAAEAGVDWLTYEQHIKELSNGQ